MIKLKIGIINMGLGNLSSISGVIKRLDFKVLISDNILELKKNDLIIIPGVGSFDPAMQGMKKLRLHNFLLNWSEKMKPLIGICLGMQLLGNYSEEAKEESGLSIIEGKIKHLGENISHIGWNTIKYKKTSKQVKSKLNKNYYFNHSYYYSCEEKYILAKTFFNKNIAIPSIIKKNKTVGFQFHPEKSQQNGETILKKYITELCNVEEKDNRNCLS